jgi:hypothetical protein
MSYHILHQFDEQWLADLSQGDESKKGASGPAGTEVESRRRLKLNMRDGHRWALIAAAVLMATFALLFAIDATQRAEALQQRLDAVERQMTGINSQRVKNSHLSD